MLRLDDDLKKPSRGQVIEDAVVAVARESAAELQSLQASLKAAESLQGLAVAASRPEPVQQAAAYHPLRRALGDMRRVAAERASGGLRRQ